MSAPEWIISTECNKSALLWRISFPLSLRLSKHTHTHTYPCSLSHTLLPLWHKLWFIKGIARVLIRDRLLALINMFLSGSSPLHRKSQVLICATAQVQFWDLFSEWNRFKNSILCHLKVIWLETSAVTGCTLTKNRTFLLRLCAVGDLNRHCAFAFYAEANSRHKHSVKGGVNKATN